LIPNVFQNIRFPPETNQQFESHWKDDKRDGPYTLWHENGQKRIESHYKNGEQDGLWTWWDEDGNKTVEIQFKDGAEVSREEF